ncbi:MAG: hypothetical protein Q8K89_08845, partial [Actinomycetota bacterium]|nr:hypothetical protein [Actinomycetota bacterium]
MRVFRISRRSWLVLGLGIAAVAVVFALIATGVGGEIGSLWVSDIGEFAIIAAAAAFILRAAIGLGEGPLRTQWLLIGAGAASFALGDAIWSYVELIQGREVPYPGLPDVFYLLEYPLLMLALVLAFSSYRGLVKLQVPVIVSACAVI